jgi:hypothetical protein
MKKYVHLGVCVFVAWVTLHVMWPVHHTWTLSQVKDNTTGSGTTVAVTVVSTGSGHLLVAGLLDGTTGDTISAVTAAACTGSWTHATNTVVSLTGAGSADLYYCLNSASGQTSITITHTSCTICVGVIWEAASTLGNIAVDAGATPSGNHTDSACTSCAGVALTLSGNNDFIAALAVCGATCSGVTGTGWTNDLSNPTGDGVAHGITSGSQTAPTTWTGTSGIIGSNAAAFQETASGGACTPELAILGVGLC